MYLHKEDARLDVDVYAIAEKLAYEDFYKADYEESTLKLISDNIKYETVKDSYLEVMGSVLK